MAFRLPGRIADSIVANRVIGPNGTLFNDKLVCGNKVTGSG